MMPQQTPTVLSNFRGVLFVQGFGTSEYCPEANNG